MLDLSSELLKIFNSIWNERSVALHSPRFMGNELEYLTDCVTSTFVSSVGHYVDSFEAELADFAGCKRAVATSSGTSALQVSLRLAGVLPNDEVLLSPLTFVATAHAITYLGAIPHFVDCEELTLGIDPLALDEWLDHVSVIRDGHCVNKRTSRRIKALLPTHVFGFPCQINSLFELSKKYSLELVEDAAESLGSFYSSTHTGLFGSLGALSFNGNKIITTGGGGAIITDDNNLADHAKHLTTTAKKPHSWEYWHDEIGYNYRLPNINAALGLAQLEKIQSILEDKRQIHKRYIRELTGLTSSKILSLLQGMPGTSPNYWLNCIRLSSFNTHEREKVLELTNANGYQTRPVWALLHRLPMYTDCQHSPLTVAEKLERELINIPSNTLPDAYNEIYA